MKRVDLTSRSLLALIEPGGCFAGFLAEIVFAADRSFMADGRFEGDNRPEAVLALTPANMGCHPMSNGLTRLATRFLGAPEHLERLAGVTGDVLDAGAAEELGLCHGGARRHRLGR